MRILHINAGNLYGGIESLLKTLARQRGLCPGLDQHFALFYEGRHSDELRREGVPVRWLGEVRASRPWTVLAARRRLRRLLAEGDYDAMLTHGCWNHAVAAPEARRRGIPVVFWGHMIESGSHWVQRWASWSPPDFVLANSLATQASVREHLFRNTASQVLHLPVPAPALDNPDGSRRQIRTRLGTPDDAVVVVTACRMEGWKGHEVLLEAVASLRGVPGWECWVAGGAQRPAEERYLAGLRERARRAGIADRVRFLGQRDDIPYVLAAADVHCQPNTSPEPFGIAFVEAMYAGLPVVTSRFGGAVEILNDECGVLLPPGDAAALAEALSTLVTNAPTRRRLGENGRKRAAELADPGRQLARFNALVSEVCHG